MIGQGDTFKGGNKSARDKLNRLRADASAVSNIRGDDLIHVSSNGNGYSFTFDVKKLISLLPSRIAAGVHIAYCKTAAGAGATIQAYLGADWDGLGTEPTPITVYCKLIEETNLSGCKPTLTDGMDIPVANYGGQWRCLWPFHGAETCDG